MGPPGAFIDQQYGRALLKPLARHTHRPAVAQREGAATLYAICSVQFLNGTTASSKSIVDQATLLPEPSASALKRGMGIRRPLATGNMPKGFVQSREGVLRSLEDCSTTTRLNRDGACKARRPEQTGQPHGWVVELGLSSRWCRVRVVEFGLSSSGCRVRIIRVVESRLSSCVGAVLMSSSS